MSLTSTLERAANSDFTSYAPDATVVAVNALLPLGKDGSLRAIEDYLAQADRSSDHHGLFLVMRVLFDVPAEPGYQPPLRLGGSQPAPPPDPRRLPLFPIMLVDDMPLMLVSGYVLGGEPEPLEQHIAYYRNHGVLRTQPLRPAKSKDALAHYARAYRDAYGVEPSERERAFVQSQLDRVP